jgi:tRNA(Leu) C34 or U34 (ribose-2'-O)-methylase TrmL
MTPEAVLDPDQNRRMNTSKIFIGLSNPKSPSNVGAVMRAAGCFRADAVFFTGQRYARAARFNTDTHDAGRDIPLTGVSCLLESVPAETQIVCVEFVEGAVPLPGYRHPERAFYIFGPEDGTLAQEIIDRADAVVYIPTTNCLNLAATVNIVLYDRTAKSALPVSDDEFIRKSRDNNNKAQVKKSNPR